MALAIKLEGMVREGKVASYRNLAEAGHVSRARLSQIVRLSELAPDIQEQLLFIPKVVRGSAAITESALRQIATSIDWGPPEKTVQASHRLNLHDSLPRHH